jgi:hypothetical protein
VKHSTLLDLSPLPPARSVPLISGCPDFVSLVQRSEVSWEVSLDWIETSLGAVRPLSIAVAVPN